MVTESVQRFIWSHCITEVVKFTLFFCIYMYICFINLENFVQIHVCSILKLGSVEWLTQSGKIHGPYLKNFLKKLISEAELSSCPVLDEIYERYAHYMASLKV